MPQFSFNTTAAIRKPNWHTAKCLQTVLQCTETPKPYSQYAQYKYNFTASQPTSIYIQITSFL